MTMNATFDPGFHALRHDPQAVARQHAGAGGCAIGYVGNDVPVALILAAGALPVRVRGNAGFETPGVDRFIESSFAPELRVIADQWLRGMLDHLQAVVFARADDSGQRLYYYLCELQRRGLCGGPRALLYDVAGLARGASFEHTLESTRQLAADLGSSNTALAGARQRVRRREELLRAVQSRRLLPAPLGGNAAWLFEYVAACDWRDSFDETARRWLADASLLHIPKRVMLAGDPPPDGQLHAAIEAAGASVVLELTESGFSTSDHGTEPFAAIAAEFQARESPALSMRRDARWLVNRAQDSRADAVLIWLSEQNEALPWEIARQVQSLRTAGIPALLLSRQPWQITAAALTQVMHFARAPGDFK